MYAGAAVLATLLVALFALPLIHSRAVRLTASRLDAAAPALSDQIRADKDQLRAEFAMTTRRLEMSVENMKTKAGIQLVEMNQKDEELKKLRADLGEKLASIFALEARDRAFRDQVRAAEEEIEVKSDELHECRRELAAKTALATGLAADYAESVKLAEARKVEVMVLRTQVEATKSRDAILLSVMGSPAKWQAGDVAPEIAVRDIPYAQSHGANGTSHGTNHGSGNGATNGSANGSSHRADIHQDTAVQ
jgi:2-methylaconitate cis-trans-isomerase PrpF